MSPGLVLGEGMTERFKQEAITIAQLHHPSIVSVYSVRQAEGLHFFVMQYVQGRSLEQVLQQARRLPLPIVRSILYQVGSALTYAHRARVIHRDVKPANILIDQDGNAVVTDFGIAKAAERPTQTLTGALVGTPAYMSPEQCAGGEVSGSSDQYSLGAVAYELITGEPPVRRLHAHRDAGARRARAAARSAELCGDCPPEVAAAIHRMLEKDPAARWPRMVDALTALGAEALPEEHPLRAELSPLRRSAPARVPSDSPTPTSPAPRTRRSGSISAASGRSAASRSCLRRRASRWATASRSSRCFAASTAPGSRLVRSSGARTIPPCCAWTPRRRSPPRSRPARRSSPPRART